VKHLSEINSGVRTVLVVPTDASWVLLGGIAQALADAGFDPLLVSSPGERLECTAKAAGVDRAAIRMCREIAPVSDVLSLWRLYRLLRSARPTITNVGMPKAGLLAGLAAWLAGVPCRVYTLHGLRLETTRGWKRTVLTMIERISCVCAHHVICVSPSLRQRAVELKLVSRSKAIVLGNGSCGGIDVERFSPEVRKSLSKIMLAKRLGIPGNVPVIGFVGRLTRDKGVTELVHGFLQLRQTWTDLRLLLVGEFEDGDPVPPGVRKEIESNPNVVRGGLVNDTAPYYGLMDVLVLPTFREGLGVVALEAQACEVPVVTTTATGAIDSIVDGVTGFHIPVGDTNALIAMVDRLLRDASLRVSMGQAGRQRVVQRFRREAVENAVVEKYRRMLQRKGLPSPSPRQRASQQLRHECSVQA
jgi:glycosyltransferase involved in cell wall biosynthesis